MSRPVAAPLRPGPETSPSRLSAIWRGRSLPVHWIMLAPALLIIGGFILYPAVNALWLSVTETNLLNLSAQTFVGLDNFIGLIDSAEFHKALRNSIVWTLGNVAFQLFFGMIGALLLNQAIRGRGLIRGLVLLPWATPSVLVALMWMWILDPNLGILNEILQAVGLQDTPVAWLADPATALPTLMFIDIWQGIPFFAVMLLAALQAVPSELIEAARIDGASPWKTFWYITLRLIMPTILITTILRLIWTANYFDLILILTNGGPANASLTVPLHAYHTAYRGFEFGTAAALGVTQAALLLILVIIYMRLTRKAEIT